VSRLTVTLSSAEIETASYVGFRRGQSALTNGYHDDAAERRPHHTTHIEGAVAECVVAKALGVYWDPSFRLNREIGDMITPTGTRVEVRYTRRAHGRLPLHERDPDEHIAVLVRGGYRRFEIVGGILIESGKIPDYWDETLERPCFMVPASDLPISIEDLQLRLLT
jgi:hypothetical protein